MIWISLTLLLSVFLEANYINIPLTLAVLIFWTVINQKKEMYFFSFIAGVLLDFLTFGQLGVTSVLFTIIIFVILLYTSKFEIRTLGFVITFCFLGSFLYLFIKGFGNLFFGSLLITLIEAISFAIYQKYNLQK